MPDRWPRRADRRAEVTIVVPAHNVGRYLGACLDSLRAQTEWARCLAIVVDDGSVDDTGEVGARYAALDSRIQCLTQRNGGPGPGSARNHGLRRVATRFVMFVDGDDELTPRAVELLLGAVTEDDLDLAIGATEQFPIGRTWPWSGYFDQGARSVTNLDEVPLLVHDARTCNKLYRTRALRASGLRFGERMHFEDALVTVPLMLRQERLGLVGDAVHRYRKRAEGGSIMDAHFTRLENYWDHLAVVERLARLAPRLPPRRRPVLQSFLVRSFQGFVRRAPSALPPGRREEFFARARRALSGADPDVVLGATRDASERAGFVTMMENDVASFLDLPRLTRRLEAYRGDLYLAVPTSSDATHALLRTGSTRAWADSLEADTTGVTFRLRLRIQGAHDLDQALERVVLRGLRDDRPVFEVPVQLALKDAAGAQHTARITVPREALGTGETLLRLGFETATGRTDRWVRLPRDTVAEGPVRLAQDWVGLTDHDGRAALRAGSVRDDQPAS
ncbi:MAG: glycosyltransferase family 2 protein [Propionicimonas sp.]|nr:glycosyltransferase family 2 protein [Propionicimonas sp.]